jgi:hypothetical protein
MNDALAGMAPGNLETIGFLHPGSRKLLPESLSSAGNFHCLTLPLIELCLTNA